MAKNTVVQFIDDRTGDLISPDDHVSRVIVVDGLRYELDLTEATSAELDAALSTFTSRATGVKEGRKPAAKTVRADKEQTAAIREWANRNGHNVASRGRISASVVEAFDAAH